MEEMKSLEHLSTEGEKGREKKPYTPVPEMTFWSKDPFNGGKGVPHNCINKDRSDGRHSSAGAGVGLNLLLGFDNCNENDDPTNGSEIPLDGDEEEVFGRGGYGVNANSNPGFGGGGLFQMGSIIMDVPGYYEVPLKQPREQTEYEVSLIGAGGGGNTGHSGGRGGLVQGMIIVDQSINSLFVCVGTGGACGEGGSRTAVQIFPGTVRVRVRVSYQACVNFT